MRERVYAQECFRDLPSRVDQESISRGELHDSEVGQRSVGGGDFVIRIGEQLETESFLGAELLVRVDGVEAHA